MQKIKNVIFTFIAVFVIPLIFFLLVEASLRVLGVGTSYEIYNSIEIDGERYYQENPSFATQFYPPSLGIGPLYNTFKVDRAPETLRVYILGGSAAQGFPHVNHGLDRHLQTQLKAAFPSRKVEVINTAMTSVNSHVVYEVARTLPKDSADFAVVLMGNNEVVGPYGPGTFNQNFLSNITLIRSLQMLKRTRIWQALSSSIRQMRGSDDREELEWQGMQMFTEHNVTHDDPRLESVYSHYKDNMRDTIALLQKKGMHVILSSVPVNLRDSAPFGSMHTDGLTASDIESWESLHSVAIELFEQENWDAAIDGFNAALKVDPDFADTHFYLAKAYENIEQFEISKKHYRRALDLDTLRFRSDTRMSAVVDKVANNLSDNSQFDYIDSAAIFEKASYPFQPGWNLLLEHVHYDFSGNYLLGAEIARPIVQRTLNAESFAPLKDTEVAERIGFPNHETIVVMDRLMNMIQTPPFTGQVNHDELEAFVAEKKSWAVEAVGSPDDVIERRKRIVQEKLADWEVHYELAELNLRQRDGDAAYFHLKTLIELYPHNRESYEKLAELLSKSGKNQEAISLLERSLSYARGDSAFKAKIKGWLGMLYLRDGNYEKGTTLLEQVTEDHSDELGLTMRAYGTLVKYSSDAGKHKDTEKYLNAAERYANNLIRSGKHKDFPMLLTRMVQISNLAGDEARADEWMERSKNMK